VSDAAGLRAKYEAEGVATERYASTAFWDRRYHQRRYGRIAVLLSTVLTRGSSFLDVGCGTGEYVALARALGARTAIGVDVSSAYCRRLLPSAPVAQADALTLPFRAKAFDVVLFSEVVEHLAPDSSCSAMREVHRVAGRAVVTTTPNGRAAIRRLARRLSPERVDRADAEVGHINLLEADALRRLGEVPGWQPQTVQVSHILPPAIGAGMHLPASWGRTVARLEMVCERLAPRQGNVLLMVCRPAGDQ
jgi:SAM-dependent methyltransferase